MVKKGASMPSTDFTEAKSTGENNKLPAFPMHAPKDDYDDFQKHAEMQTKYLKMHNVVGGRRRRRKSRKKRRRRRRRRSRRHRRRRQRGGQKGNYGKPGIGSEDSLCGAYQTPEETQYTPDKYIVVPQPTGSSGGPLEANNITVNLAKALTQARANSEGDFSVVDSTFQDDREKIGMGAQDSVDADSPPPEMKDGWHPRYGKNANRYKKLDPDSANAMPKTGDAETDAIVAKQKSKS